MRLLNKERCLVVGVLCCLTSCEGATRPESVADRSSSSAEVRAPASSANLHPRSKKRQESSQSPERAAAEWSAKSFDPEQWQRALAPAALREADTDDPNELVAHLAQQAVGWDEQETLRHLLGDVGKRPNLVEAADRLLREGLPRRGGSKLSITEPIDWGKNPENDSNWHYRLNNFTPLLRLLGAYAESENEVYVLHVRRLMLDWIEYNLVKKRANAKKWHDMGAGLRSGVLAYLLSRELTSPQPDVEVVARLVLATERHARVLADPNLFTHGNHGVYMMVGLQRLLHALPNMNDHAELQRYATDRMRDLITSQFGPNGFHLEHSPSYHLMLAKQFRALADQDLFHDLPELGDIADLAQSHAVELFHPNGDDVMVGDSEQGDGLPPQQNNAGQSGLPSSDPYPLHVYPEEGYVVFRSNWGQAASKTDDFLFIGAGHHSRIHKHADHGSFEWSFQGQPVLIDSGKYTYDRGPWRDFFTSTRAGNAVEVDGKSYGVLEPTGSALRSTREVAGTFQVHARMRHPTAGVTQDRFWLIRPGEYLLVVDLLLSKQTKDYRQWFHLHPTLDVDRAGKITLHGQSSRGAPRLFVRELVAGTKSQVELQRGAAPPNIGGWVSFDYRQKEPRTSLAYLSRGKRVAFATLFSKAPVATATAELGRSRLDVSWQLQGGAPEAWSLSPYADPAVSQRQP